MKFIVTGSKHPGVPTGPNVYVIRPTRRIVADGMFDIRYGMRARFSMGAFDSQVAQIEEGWTDDERELVERRLMAHGDFGIRMFLHPNETEARAKLVEMGLAVEAVVEPSPMTPGARCIAEGVGENPLCLKPVFPGSEFCPEHVAIYDPGRLADAQAAAPVPITPGPSVEPVAERPLMEGALL